MTEQEKRDWLIEGLKFTLEESGWDANEAYDQELMIKVVTEAIALLEEQTPKTMTLEEAKAYLASDDQDKNPLWVQWATSSVKGGWVLSHAVEDLMRRYESIYQARWVLWTQKPSDEQKEAVLWKR